MRTEPREARWRLPTIFATLAWVSMLSLQTTPFAAAAAAGPFDGLSGLWSGKGTVTYASGTKEPLRCRVQYVQNDEDNLQQALRCAADSYKFEINAYFDHVDGNISGIWSEQTQDVHGTLSGKVKGGRIDGNLQGPGFVAQLVVTTRGDRQQVTIEAELEEIRSVAIEVRKTPK